VTLLVVLAGVVALRKLSDPMLEKLESHAALLEQEVAERKQAQERAHHLNQVLRAIRNVNQLITAEKDRDRLIGGACENLVETRGFDSAWIALLDDKGNLQTSAEAGLGEDFLGLQKLLQEGGLPDCAIKAQKRQEVIITRDPVSECPECPLVLRNTYQRGSAGMTMPLEHQGKVYGLMCVSLPSGFADDPEEQGLFREVGRDIAYALYSLEQEENRRKAEDDLKAGEELLNEVGEMASIGGWELDVDTRSVKWTRQTYRIHEVPEDEPIKLDRAVTFFDLPERKSLEEALEICMEQGESFDLELPFTTAKGNKLWTRAMGRSVRENGKIKKLQGTFQNITEKKRADEELIASEARYRRLFEAARDGILMLDPDSGHIVDVNPFLVELLGYSREEFLGRELWEIGFFKDIKESKRGFEKLQDEGYIRYENLPLQTKDGRHIDVEFISNIYMVEDKNIIQCIIRDITDKKRTEDALKESEHRLRALMNNLPGIAYRCRNRPDWPMEFLSQGSKKLTGYEPEELINGELNYYHIIHPDDRDKVWEAVQKGVRRDRPYQIEYRIRTKAGEELWVWEQGQAVSRTSENEEILEGIIVDISEQKHAEAVLKQSEKRYRELSESIRDAILVADPDRNITDCNPAFSELFGYSLDEIKGKKTLFLYDDEEEFQRTGEALRSHSGQALFLYTINYRKKSGEVFPGETSVFYLRDSEDNPIGFIGLIRDVSERRQLEEQLNQAMKMEAIGRLAGGVAHDFNNALTPIMTITGALLKELDPENPLYSDIKEIERAGERCTSLTRQLLAFGRRQALDIEVLNLNNVVSDMEKMLGRLIGEDVELVKFLDPALGNVKADAGQMEQILANLAVNARDAMPQGGQLTIETGNMRLGEDYASDHPHVTPGLHVMLAVSDTGFGMDEETRSKVFEPFYTTKEKGKGTGLGLSTVYGIVKQMGGNVWCYSEPGKGTTFKIYLPRVEEELERKTSRETVVPASWRGTETILVVEDDENVRKVAARALESQGYKVLEARSGEEALGVCEKLDRAFHLMVTDVVMPGMSGKELAERLAPLYPQMKVLYISGYTDNAIVHHGVLDEGTDFLQKPFTTESLAMKVREVLDRE
ncbi:MAG: PAS domain S-box protein, partial [bacterium]